MLVSFVRHRLCEFMFGTATGFVRSFRLFFTSVMDIIMIITVSSSLYLVDYLMRKACQQISLEQECIPVGCVPPAAVAVWGVSTRHPPQTRPPSQTPPPGTRHPPSPRSRKPPGPDPPWDQTPTPRNQAPPPLWTDTHL